MNPETRSVHNVLKSMAASFLPVCAMYLIWCAVSMVMTSFGALPFPYTAVDSLVVVSVFVYMATASLITAIFIVYVDDFLLEIPALRFLMLMVTFTVAALVYVLISRFGLKGNLVAGLGTANLLVFACLAATWMTRALNKPSELVPVCAVVALADLFSVLAGPTRQLAEGIAIYYEKGMEGPPPLTDYILIKIAVPGLAVPMPLFGVSDWIILTFLCSALARFGLNDSLGKTGLAAIKQKRRLAFYFPMAAIGLTAAVLLAQFSGMFLPALPVMVIVFLAHSLVSHREMRQLESKEWVLLGCFSAILILLLVSGLYLGS